MNPTVFLCVSAGVFVPAAGLFIVRVFRRQRRVLALNGTGCEYLRCDMHDEAIGCFMRARELDRSDALTRYNLGFALYFGKKHPEAARGELEEAVRHDPAMAGAHYALGHLLFHVDGEADTARVHLETALALEPGLGDAHNSLGFMEIEGGNWAGALERFRKAAEADNARPAGLCNCAVACIYQGKNAEALHYADAYAAMNPAGTAAYKNLGNIYGAAGMPYKAVGALEKALALDREDWIVHFWLGCLFLQTGSIGRAVTSFHEALRLRPRLALAFYNLALCYEAMGQRKTARRYIDTAIELNPAFGEGLI